MKKSEIDFERLVIENHKRKAIVINMLGLSINGNSSWLDILANKSYDDVCKLRSRANKRLVYQTGNVQYGFDTSQLIRMHQKYGYGVFKRHTKEAGNFIHLSGYSDKEHFNIINFVMLYNQEKQAFHYIIKSDESHPDVVCLDGENKSVFTASFTSARLSVLHRKLKQKYNCHEEQDKVELLASA